MVKPSRRREMAQDAVRSGRCSIKLACLAFRVSLTCYRYQPRLAPENAEIADKLIQLTYNQRNWGFGLCFLYLRNVKGYRWNHKRTAALLVLRKKLNDYWGTNDNEDN